MYNLELSKLRLLILVVILVYIYMLLPNLQTVHWHEILTQPILGNPLRIPFAVFNVVSTEETRVGSEEARSQTMYTSHLICICMWTQWGVNFYSNTVVADMTCGRAILHREYESNLAETGSALQSNHEWNQNRLNESLQPFNSIIKAKTSRHCRMNCWCHEQATGGINNCLSLH